MFKIKVLRDKHIAVKIGEFLTGPLAFDQTWTPKEKMMVKKAVLESIKGKNHRYWYIEERGEIIAAIGVRENKYGSRGYEMDSDYLAVHKNYRLKGIANNLLKEVEKYVKNKNGRYLHILTCNIPSYIPANNFYKKNGYKKVAEIPDYYIEGEGRIDYFKIFK